MSDELKQVTHIDNVRLGDDEQSVVIIDQTQLPNRTVYLTLRTPQEMYDAIQLLQVRGAPAIGICAGYSIYALARQWGIPDYAAFARKFHEEKEYLNSSRPTASSSLLPSVSQRSIRKVRPCQKPSSFALASTSSERLRTSSGRFCPANQ